MADTPVSIREVAARAGVSLGTVSNVLNRPDVVAEPTRIRVQAAIKELGFIRNESARQLRAGRSRTIGLVVLDVANPFFTDVARGVEDEASEAGLAVILCNSDDQKAKESRYLEVLEEHRVQGILITPVAGADERLARLQRRGTPVVLVDSRSPSRGQCSVSVDDVLGGDLAVSHLLDAGHEQIAFVGGPLSIRQVADRHDGAVRALQRAGRSQDDLHMFETPALNVAAGQRAGAELAGLPAATPADRRVLRQRPARAGRAAGDDQPPDPGAGRHRDRRLRRRGVRRRGRGAAVLGPPAAASARPGRRPAAGRGGAGRRHAPAPAGGVRAGPGGPGVQPGPAAPRAAAACRPGTVTETAS